MSNSSAAVTVSEQMQQQWLALCSSDDVTDRLAAIRALSSKMFGQLTPEIAEALIQRLGDEDEQITLEALQILQSHAQSGKGPLQTEWLVRCAHEHPLPRIRLEAIRGLAGNAAEEALACLQDIACNRPDIEQDEDWDDWWDMQLAAIKALGETGAKAAADTLQQLWRSEEGHSIEAEIFAALAHIQPAGTDLLAGIALKEMPTVRRRALNALAVSNDQLASTVLEKALSDKEPQVRVAAIEGLAQLSDSLRPKNALAMILQLLEDANSDVRAAALKAAAALSPGQQLALDSRKMLHLLSQPDDACAATIQLLSASSQPLSGDVKQRILSLLAQNPMTLSQSLGQFLQAQKNAEPEQQAIWYKALQQQLQHYKAPAFCLRPLIVAWGDLSDNCQQDIQSVSKLLTSSDPAIRQIVIEELINISQKPVVLDPQQPDSTDNLALALLDRCLSGEAFASASEQDAAQAEQIAQADLPEIIELKESTGDIPVQMLETPDTDPKPKKIPTVEEMMASMPDYTESLVEEAGAESTLNSINMSAQEAILREHEPELSQDDRLRRMLDHLDEELEPYRDVVEGHLQAADKVLSSPHRVAPMPGGDNQALAIRALPGLPLEQALQKIAQQLTASRPQAKEALVALYRLLNAQDQLPVLADDTLSALDVIIESADPDLRQLSLRVIGLVAPEHPRILLSLEDPDSLVILEALHLIQANSQLKTAANSELIKPLLRHKEMGVQQLALQVLAACDPQAIEAVLAASMESHGEMLMAGRKAIALLDSSLVMQWLDRALTLSEKPNQRLLVAELMAAVNYG
ncbi:HEAT repeat domain-containing protein [Pelagibaculum spongiae]|uniref:HEAT repeat domain-containing protein n=1 Tax=Pelagibaculum spongiae TaxID=2080658 RepID=A0A2V1H0D9_9GAMM|nr:HEAT repeat domain-containing protein [Pelagibaculum spongiae]PVZ72476.1 hypothetical protein DC094_05595 [Pelagibaculum spongiae]